MNYCQIKREVVYLDLVITNSNYRLYIGMEFCSGTLIFTQRNQGFRRITLGKLIFKMILLYTENQAVLSLLSLPLSQPWLDSTSGPKPLLWVSAISLRHTTFSRTPLDEWSARRRNLYLTTHSTHKRLTSMPPAGFEPAISARERPQTEALDRAAIGTGFHSYQQLN